MPRSMKPFSIALFVSAGVLFGSLAQAQTPPAPTFPDSVRAHVAAAKKQVKLYKMEEFKALFDQGKAGMIIDVRQEIEFSDGHVPGAINVPRGLIEFRIWEEVGFPNTDLGKQLTLYCQSGSRCALAAKTLQEFGFTNVASVDMAFGNWVKAGYPVSKPK